MEITDLRPLGTRAVSKVRSRLSISGLPNVANRLVSSTMGHRVFRFRIERPKDLSVERILLIFDESQSGRYLFSPVSGLSALGQSLPVSAAFGLPFIYVSRANPVVEAAIFRSNEAIEFDLVAWDQPYQEVPPGVAFTFAPLELGVASGVEEVRVVGLKEKKWKRRK